MIGVAIAPKGTAKVLPTSTVTAAFSGGKPIATSITPTMATGAPKPANASNTAQKQKARSTPSTRVSGEMPLKVRIRSSW